MTNQLNWITDSDLESCVREVIIKGLQGIQKSKKDVARNSLDPFSALFDASLQSITLSEWLISEQRRQAQKTLQNALANQILEGKITNFAFVTTSSHGLEIETHDKAA